MVAKLHALGNKASHSGQLLEYLLFVAGGPALEVVFEQQHLLADIPLDRQPVMGDGIQYPRHRLHQRPFVGRYVGFPGVRADVHVGRGHGGGDADLKPDVRADHAFIAQPVVDLVRLHGRVPVSGGERDG